MGISKSVFNICATLIIFIVSCNNVTKSNDNSDVLSVLEKSTKCYGKSGKTIDELVYLIAPELYKGSYSDFERNIKNDLGLEQKINGAIEKDFQDNVDYCQCFSTAVKGKLFNKKISYMENDKRNKIIENYFFSNKLYSLYMKLPYLLTICKAE